LIETGDLFESIGMPALGPVDDRVMICGSPAMLAETSALLDARGFRVSAHVGDQVTTWWSARSYTVFGISDIARDLLHPAIVRVRRDAGNVH
jgi:NAD(P)H-flavin reductase